MNHALLLAFLAFQMEDAGIREKILQMTCSMCESITREGFCKAVITIDESPSITKFSRCKETAKEQAKRVA
jgi:hypothetical protein